MLPVLELNEIVEHLEFLPLCTLASSSLALQQLDVLECVSEAIMQLPWLRLIEWTV